MKTSEELFKAWSSLLQQENIMNEDDLKNLQDVSFCRNHNFLGRYNIPVILLKSAVENDRKYDGRLYKRFFLFDKYSISNDWYHSETETNRRDFFRWFVDLCKQRGVYDKVPQIIIEEAESSDSDIKNDLFENNAVKDKQRTENTSITPYYQDILFGAPGTGKSFKIDDPEKGYGLKNVDESRKFRTTFHPDYDYAQFVGAYKPKKEGDAITYSFVPQVFAKAYAAAWNQYFKAGNASTTGNQVYLVIEEINRGNCAQIFGDIFQLLDRDSEGFSQYPIDADCDFAEWLENDEAGLKSVWEKYKEEVGKGKLKLPPNLNILATMNTSDQSLFPMDSAFKRRFDWEYVPISFTDEEGEEKEAAAYQIEIDGTPYPWKDFVETINDKILTLTESEDKQLGEFFIKPDNGNTISEGRFLGKVMFYLWNEVCKDEHKNGSFFRVKIDGKEEYFTFQDLYKKQGLLKQFMDELLKKE
ncbi:MAG: AAA family ATPase [Fibrobacter sp.]|nr:AAA family ATPase [Fibrobacter sp.]